MQPVDASTADTVWDQCRRRSCHCEVLATLKCLKDYSFFRALLLMPFPTKQVSTVFLLCISAVAVTPGYITTRSCVRIFIFIIFSSLDPVEQRKQANDSMFFSDFVFS